MFWWFPGTKSSSRPREKIGWSAFRRNWGYLVNWTLLACHRAKLRFRSRKLPTPTADCPGNYVRRAIVNQSAGGF